MSQQDEHGNLCSSDIPTSILKSATESFARLFVGSKTLNDALEAIGKLRKLVSLYRVDIVSSVIKMLLLAPGLVSSFLLLSMEYLSASNRLTVFRLPFLTLSVCSTALGFLNLLTFHDTVNLISSVLPFISVHLNVSEYFRYPLLFYGFNTVLIGFHFIDFVAPPSVPLKKPETESLVFDDFLEFEKPLGGIESIINAQKEVQPEKEITQSGQNEEGWSLSYPQLNKRGDSKSEKVVDNDTQLDFYL